MLFALSHMDRRELANMQIYVCLQKREEYLNFTVWLF